MRPVDDQTLNDAAKSYRVLKHRMYDAQKSIDRAKQETEQLSTDFQDLNEELDAMLAEASELLDGDLTFSDEDRANADLLLREIESEYTPAQPHTYDKLESLPLDGSWNNLMAEVEDYARRNEINFGDDPFDGLLTQTERDRIGEKILKDYMVVMEPDERRAALETYLSFGLLFFSSDLVKSGDWDEQINQLCGKMADLLAQYVHIDPKYNHEEFSQKPGNLSEWFSYLNRFYPDLVKSVTLSPDELEAGTASQRELVKALRVLAKRPSWVGLSFSLIYQFARNDVYSVSDKPLFLVKGHGGAEMFGTTVACKLIAGFVNWLDALTQSSQENADNFGNDGDVRDLVMAVLKRCGFGESDQDGIVKTIQEFAIDVYNSLHGEEDQIDGNDVQVGVCNYIMRFFASLQCRADGSSYMESVRRVDEKFVRRCQVAGYGLIDLLLKGTQVVGKVDFVSPVFALVNSVDIDGWSDLMYEAVARARAVFRGYYIDLEKMDEDLERGWQELLDEGITVPRRQY